ncbi:MAG: NTP transferase domain-containing protein [Rhizobacter sp.]|nr:NTP transferase domain-containing protein [Chlorobiales bacterium]
MTSMPLYGLVLAGGKSVRMQQDKGSMDYHGETQREHVAKLLAPYCEKVFVSCRTEQAAIIEPGLVPLFDTFLDLGPAGGMLTALRAFPNAAWLVAACDLPYLTNASIEHLIARRNPLKVATAFHNPASGLPEPLLAIWESKSVHRIFDLLAEGYDCPRKVLINSDCEILAAPFLAALANINTPAEAIAARKALSVKPSVKEV